MSTCEHHRRGGALVTLLWIGGVLALMILMAIPVVGRTRRENHAQACADNLAVLLAAQERHAMDHQLSDGAKMALKDLTGGTSPTLAAVPVCPDGGTYELAPVGRLPVCSHPGHALWMADKQRQAVMGQVKPQDALVKE